MNGTLLCNYVMDIYNEWNFHVIVLASTEISHNICHFLMITGSAFRETLIAEHHLEFNLNCSSPAYNKEHHYHLLIDNHAPRSFAFSQAFEKQNTMDPISLKKLFLRSMFCVILCEYSVNDSCVIPELPNLAAHTTIV